MIVMFPTDHCCSTRINDTNVCDAIKVGDEVTFEVTLEDTFCVDQRDFELKIGPSGLDETLTVLVHVMCDCDCAKKVGLLARIPVRLTCAFV